MRRASPKLQESSDKLLQEMRGRVEELDRQDETFAKFLVNVTIQFRSGEINEESFKVIGDHCGANEGEEREREGRAHGRPGNPRETRTATGAR